MNQVEAIKQYDSLGVIVLLDAPPKIQLGVDNTAWIVGNKFKGVKLIPLGVHYVHYSLADEKYQFKLGFFCHLQPHARIVVRRWHTHFQDFLPVDQETQKMYEHAVNTRDLDNYLGPYPSDKYASWTQMSNYITKDVLDFLNPIVPNQVFTIAEEYSNSEEAGAPQEDDQEMEERTDKDIKKEMKVSSNKEDFKVMAGTIYYSDVPSRLVKHGQTGEQLTQMNFDKSEILKTLIKKYNNNPTIILGELQYAFVLFLLGEHFESFEQWKKLFILLCSCESYIDENPSFYLDVMALLYHQIQQLPKDFFIDPLSSNNFIGPCLRNLIEVCESTGSKGDRKKVGQRAVKLRTLIEQTFHHTNEEEDDEYAPQIINDFEFIQI